MGDTTSTTEADTLDTTLIKPTAAHAFLKTHTNDTMRIASDATDTLIRILTTIAAKMAPHAQEGALTEGMTTIKGRHLRRAFESFLDDSGPSFLEPTTLRTAINGITNDELKQLIKLLRSDIQQQVSP